eukprot:2903229-Amphidinium_carterae.4
MEGKGKGKDKKGRVGKDKPKGKPKGEGKPGGRPSVGSPGGYRNRDDNPNDTRPICPDFLTDRGCNKTGLCTMRHPTK